MVSSWSFWVTLKVSHSARQVSEQTGWRFSLSGHPERHQDGHLVDLLLSWQLVVEAEVGAPLAERLEHFDPVVDAGGDVVALQVETLEVWQVADGEDVVQIVDLVSGRVQVGE